MTRRERVLEMLKNGEKSCYELCSDIAIYEEFANTKTYYNHIQNLNASLSGVLNKMVKRGEIEISSNKGSKGGKIYKLKTI